MPHVATLWGKSTHIYTNIRKVSALREVTKYEISAFKNVTDLNLKDQNVEDLRLKTNLNKPHFG